MRIASSASTSLRLSARSCPISSAAPDAYGFQLLTYAAAARHERDFGRQEGYSVFTVSASMMDAVKQYIGAQEEHHHHQTFEQELQELLEKHGVQYDPNSGK